MREPEKLKIEYIGYTVPITQDEADVEILGLHLAIKCAEQRIALITQGIRVAQMKQKSVEPEKKENTDA